MSHWINLAIFYILFPIVLTLIDDNNLQNIVENDPFMETDITQKDLLSYDDEGTNVNVDGVVVDENFDENFEENSIENLDEEESAREAAAFMVDDSTDDDCSVYPNQTFFRPHFFSCHNDEAPPKLVVHDSAVANSTGDYQYPLDFTQPVRFFFDVTSFANRRYDNMRAEVYLYKRRTGWLGCGWLFLPTFGIIDNYDVCDDNLSCPVYPGRQVIEISIKPKVVFSGIFKMIHNKNVPYQLVIRLVNNRRPRDELVCVVYQTKINF